MSTLPRDSRFWWKKRGSVRAFAVFAVVALTIGVPSRGAPARGMAMSGGAPEPNSELAARWEGAVQIPGTELRMLIDLAQDRKGNWIGSAIFPGLGVKGAPLSDIAVNGSEVAFVVKGVLGGPRLKGHIDERGALAGEFQEAGNTAPFVLERAGPPQVELPRQSTPVRKELEGAWEGGFALPRSSIQVRMTFANHAGGPATASCHVKGRSEFDLPVEFVDNEGDLLTVESPSARFFYDGRFDKDTNEIRGEFQLGPYDEPLVLRPAAMGPAKAQP